jgi:hypothetical protein
MGRMKRKEGRKQKINIQVGLVGARNGTRAQDMELVRGERVEHSA